MPPPRSLSIFSFRSLRVRSSNAYLRDFDPSRREAGERIHETIYQAEDGGFHSWFFFQFLVIRQAGRETHEIRVSKHSNALERIGRSRGAQPIDFFMRFSPTCNMQFLYPTASKRVERSFDFSLRRSLSFH